MIEIKTFKMNTIHPLAPISGNLVGAIGSGLLINESIDNIVATSLILFILISLLTTFNALKENNQTLNILMSGNMCALTLFVYGVYEKNVMDWIVFTSLSLLAFIIVTITTYQYNKSVQFHNEIINKYEEEIKKEMDS